MKKILLSGLLAAVAMLIATIALNYLFGLSFPKLITEYQKAAVHRPPTDPRAYLFYLHPFLVGIILAFIWDKVKTLFISHNLLSKGVQFGLVYFLITVPGLLLSYGGSTYSLLMVASWAVTAIVASIIAGLIFENVNG